MVMGLVLFTAGGVHAQEPAQSAETGVTHAALAVTLELTASPDSLWSSPERLHTRARRVRITGRTLLYSGLVGMVAGGIVAARFYEPCPADEAFCLDFGRPLQVAIGMSFALPLVTLGAILLGRAAWLRTRAVRLDVDMAPAQSRFGMAATVTF